ncbi:MAG: PilZ domain-containing protein [Myxococcota bacterium]
MPNDRRQNERRHNGQTDASNRREAERRREQRRSEPRIEVDLWAEQTDGDAVYFRRIANLSPGGVYFEQGIPSTVGSRIKVRFTLPGDAEPVEVLGIVTRAEWDPGHLAEGVQFDSMSAETRTRIERFIGEKLTLGAPSSP